MQQYPPDLFDYKSVRRALKCWHDVRHLSQHPLAVLPLVQNQAYAGQEDGPGLVLRRLLRCMIEEMRPTEAEPDFTRRRWRYYTILKEQYINGRRTIELRDELGVSESGYFADQRQALKRLGNRLREKEIAIEAATQPTATSTSSVQAVSEKVADISQPIRGLAPVHLPQQPTPFIGRWQERQQIAGLLAQPDCRLISLIGPGGMGKSRLSIQVAQEQAHHFKDGVFFIPLAPLEQAAYVVTAVAAGVGLSFDSQTDPQEQLLNFLRQKEALLVLDNFEHVLGGVSVVQTLLQQAAGVKIITTSRERLNLRSEWVILIDGMKFPEADLLQADPLDHTTLTNYSAVQLFEGVAQRQLGEPLPESALLYVARICRLVQGMPLGIELAASWVHLIPCREIVTEIERNLDFLAGSFRDLPERHQSLRAVFTHSWNLLTEVEQTVFCRLSLFRGSFTRQAAQQVAGATLPVLHTLNNKSLLTRRPSGRYVVHVLLRQFAAERLRELPTVWTLTHDQHSRYFLRFLQAETAVLRQGGRQRDGLTRLKKELEDIRLAWRWAGEKNQVDLLHGAAEPLYLLYTMLNRLREGEQAFARVVAQQHLSTQPDERVLGLALAFQGRFNLDLGHLALAQQLLRQSVLILQQGGADLRQTALTGTLAIEANLPEADMQPEQLYETAVAYFTQAGDDWGLATAHFNLVAHYRTIGSPHHYDREQQLLQQSYTLRQKIGDQWGLAKCLNNLGIIAYERGHYPEAEQYARQGLQLHRHLGNRLGVAYSLQHLAQAVGIQGAYLQARQHYEEALAILEAFGNRREIAICLDCIGYMFYMLDDIAAAQRYYEESLHICQQMDDAQGIAWSLHNLGDVARRQGATAKARQLYQESHELHCRQEPLAWGRVVALEKLGRTTLVLGRYEEAMALLQEAFELALQTERFREAMDALHAMAQILWHWQQPEQACGCLELVLSHQATAKETLDAAQTCWSAWQHTLPS
jgi:predicted ATPase